VNRLLQIALPLVLAGVVAGCSAETSTNLAAAGGGIAVGTVTANPAVAVAVGLAVRAVADEAFKYAGRVRQGAEQDAIAEAAGALPEGGTTSWVIHHTVPVGDEHGDLTVVRDIKTRLSACKEIVFSVQDGADRQLYTTQICRRGDQWKWAAVEPAVERWGFLQ
jgi:hypothetical protein